MKQTNNDDNDSLVYDADEYGEEEKKNVLIKRLNEIMIGKDWKRFYRSAETKQILLIWLKITDKTNTGEWEANEIKHRFDIDKHKQTAMPTTTSFSNFFFRLFSIRHYQSHIYTHKFINSYIYCHFISFPFICLSVNRAVKRTASDKRQAWPKCWQTGWCAIVDILTMAGDDNIINNGINKVLAKSKKKN